MKSYPTHQSFRVKKIAGSEAGFLLIAALTLLATLTLVGTTAYILSSTDVKIGSNFKASQMGLQAAMAGVEHGREALRLLNISSTNKASFDDDLASRVGANSVLDGYTSSTDDIVLANGAVGTAPNSASYVVYLTNDDAPAETNGANSTTDSNGQVKITSVAMGPGNTTAKVQIVVKLFSAPPSPATIYSKDNVTLSGASLNISGNDGGSCGGTSLAPVYTKDPATTTTNGGPTLSGSPSTAQQGTSDIDIQGYVDALKPSASVTLTSDPSSNQTYGSAGSYTTVYADAAGTQKDGELKLTNVTGYGILLVEGNLEIAGDFSWNGLIFVTGILKTTGGGSNVKNIQGLIYVGSSALGDTAVSGTVTIGYQSCYVKDALSVQPLTVVNWKQSY